LNDEEATRIKSDGFRDTIMDYSGYNESRERFATFCIPAFFAKYQEHRAIHLCDQRMFPQSISSSYSLSVSYNTRLHFGTLAA
jgi:hypothetical protein